MRSRIHRILALRHRIAAWPLSSQVILAAWVVLVGIYCVVALAAQHSRALTTYGDLVQCAAAAFGCAGLGLNAFSTQRRTRTFWLLLTLGCGLWLAGQIIWTYFEIYLRKDVPNPFLGDVILFLHPVPMMAALAVQPHDSRDDLNVRVRYIDLSLLLIWWVYLYLFLVIPWQYITPSVARYGWSYDHLAAVENIVLTTGFGVLISRSRGAWREIYSHLFSASLLYAASSYITNRAIDGQNYYTGSIYDLPLVASFVWFGTAGIEAHRMKPARGVPSSLPRDTNPWPARIAMGAVISIPLMAVWSTWISANTSATRLFRVGVTQVTLVLAAVLIFVRQAMVDRDRWRLIEESRESFENLKHYQTQLIQAEK